MFSKCSFALILKAAIEFVLMSVEPGCELIVMLIAAVSLQTLLSSGLSTFKSADFLSGDGDLKAKLCDGDCCIALCCGLIDDVCGIIIEADEVTGMPCCAKCCCCMLCGDILKPPPLWWCAIMFN